MHEDIRAIPLSDVLAALGHSGPWKERKGGSEKYGRCPLHGAKRNNTSFSFNQDGRFNCFSCGQKGRGAIDLAMKLRGCNFSEAVEWLKGFGASATSTPQAQREEPSKTEPSEHLENPEFVSTYAKYQVKSDWLEKRGLTEDTLKKFGVFEYNNPARRSAYSGRVMVPMRRFKDGVLVGYLARSTQEPTPENPKYLIGKGVAKGLEVFGSWELKLEKWRFRFGYLVESPFAAMKFHQLGFPAVSPYGWSVSPQQAEILATLAKGWVYLPDSNRRETIGSVLHLLGQKCWVKCPEYPADDPEHLTAEQIKSLA